MIILRIMISDFIQMNSNVCEYTLMTISEKHGTITQSQSRRSGINGQNALANNSTGFQLLFSYLLSPSNLNGKTDVNPPNVSEVDCPKI